MQHQHQQRARVATLGANTLLDGILARLLKDEGYDTRVFEAYQIDLIDELPDSVHVPLPLTLPRRPRALGLSRRYEDHS